MTRLDEIQGDEKLSALVSLFTEYPLKKPKGTILPP
jgi:hypothetical protein